MSTLPTSVITGPDEPIEPRLLALVLDEAEGTEPEYEDWRIEPEDFEAERERVMIWTPTEVGQAEWAGRQWQQLEDEDVADEKLAREEIERIQHWLTTQKKRRASRKEFMAGALQRWAKERKRATGRSTFELPSCTVKVTATRDKAVITDAAATLAWAKANCKDAVKTVEEVLTSKLGWKKAENADGTLVARTEDGQVIPGITIDPAGENVKVAVRGL